MSIPLLIPYTSLNPDKKVIAVIPPVTHFDGQRAEPSRTAPEVTAGWAHVAPLGMRYIFKLKLSLLSSLNQMTV